MSGHFGIVCLFLFLTTIISVNTLPNAEVIVVKEQNGIVTHGIEDDTICKSYMLFFL